MELTRRAFNSAVVAGLAGLALPRVSLGQGGKPGWITGRDVLFEWAEVADGVHVALGQGGNAMVIVGRESSTLIDCKNTGFGGQLRREAEKLGKPVARLINTHHHADHSGGNHVFIASGDEVVAHTNAKSRIEDQVDRYREKLSGSMLQLPRSLHQYVSDTRDDITAWLGESDGWAGSDFAPSRTVSGAETEIDAGGVRIVLRYVGPGHTDNDLIVHLPEKNVVHTGDLVFHGLNPYIDVGAGATTRGWDESLEAMERLCDGDTVVVPGHGAVSDRAVLGKQMGYFRALREAVESAKGKPRDEVTALKPKGTEELGFDQMLSRNLGIVYDELAGE